MLQFSQNLYIMHFKQYPHRAGLTERHELSLMDKKKNIIKKRKKRPSKIRITLPVVLIIIAFAAIALGVRLFGKVDMISSDLGEPATASTSSGSAITTTGATTTKATRASEIEKNTTNKTSGEHYIQPAKADWNLKLVNSWNPLEKNYKQPLEIYAGTNQFDSRAIDKLRALVKDGKKYNIRVASLFRTYEHQQRLYNNRVAKEMAKGNKRAQAEVIAASVVARPGTSEHNLGLAVDFLFGKYSSLSPDYENTEAYAWMLEHCADYGFILRYPKNKQSVTGVIFEPWHYRYVGEQAAQEIMSRGICLEEYLQQKGK